MSGNARRVVKSAGIAGAVVLALGIIAPFCSVNGLAGPIRASLEAALGRRVEIGSVHFTLLTGPGFSISKVIIGEDPAFGREPFAYVDSLEAHPRILPLLSGRLVFASLRLQDTSVNLTRVETHDGARWNFAALLHRTNLAALPAVHVRSGRINFKFGNTKSIFYITEADLDAAPPSGAGGAWEARFSGQPARTDRPARGFGSLTASGRWQPEHSVPGQLAADFELQESGVNEMIGLIYGRDIGVHGLVSARAHLAGSLENLHLNGALNIQDVHRWDLLPQGGTSWPFEFEGRLNVPAERLEIASHSAAEHAPPLAVRFRVADYLSKTHWGVALNWNQFRLQPLLQLARHLGAPLPAGLTMEGTIDGAIGYAGQGSWQGQVAFQDASVTIPDSTPVRFEQAKLLFDGGRVHLPTAVARTSADDLARIEGDYDWNTGALDLSIATDSMAATSLRSQVSLASVPLLDQVQSGTWSGKLRYERQGGLAGEWSGIFHLQNAEMPVPGLAGPLVVESARAQLEGTRVVLDRIHANFGGVSATGEYRFDADSARPHRFHLTVASLDASEVENLFQPTLRRNRGLIARAFGFRRAPVPAWLEGRHLDGQFEIGSMKLAAVELNDIRGRLVWRGTTATLADITGDFQNGSITGRLTVDFRGNEPAYRLASRWKSVDWAGGKFDGEAVLDTHGTGPALLANLSSEGSFSAQDFDAAPLDQFQSVSGCYVFEWAKPVPKLRFTELEMSTGSELYLGRGALNDEGRLLIRVSNGSRELNVTGTLAQMQMDEGASQ
ncbi:MAG TPA: hypothetical protein VJN43_15120 [Bryobacteraceae bacterium]|nr:hypothetical protein [Bryobacteraceae bacterium]